MMAYCVSYIFVLSLHPETNKRGNETESLMTSADAVCERESKGKNKAFLSIPPKK